MREALLAAEGTPNYGFAQKVNCLLEWLCSHALAKQQPSLYRLRACANLAICSPCCRPGVRRGGAPGAGLRSGGHARGDR